MRSDESRHRGYAPPGQTPIVKIPARRKSLSMIAAVTNQGKVRWKVFEGAMNTDILIDFLKRLIKDSDRKTILVLDNLGVHHARKVREWMDDHEQQIEVFYLPSYSPELNPDERLNQDVKANSDKKQRAGYVEELKANMRSYLRMRQCQPDIVQNYFLDKHVLYAA